jgi:hypothetical protein
VKYKGMSPALVLLITLSLTVFAFPARPVLAQSITISPTGGPVGTLLAVNGTGFSANSAFTDRFAYGTAFEVARAGVVSSGGTLADSFNVPAVPRGSYTVRVETTSGNFTGTFAVASAISLSTASTSVGNQVAVSGTGFAGATTVTVTFDGQTIATAVTNTNGSFTAIFNVPDTVPGAHTITSNDGIISVSASLYVTQQITLSPSSGAVGSTVTVTGNGFSANQSVTITFGGSPVITSPASIFTNSVGAFSATFAAPAAAGRTTTVLASDGVVSASAIFSLLASISLSMSSGNAETPIGVTGSGFGVNTTVSVSLDNTQVAQATANNNGSFSVSFNVPPIFGGAHTVTASDGTFSASANFTVLSSARVTPPSGKVGSQVMVSGAGFSPSRSVGVTFDSTLIATVTTDDNGSFSTSANVPVSSGGAHIISATDGTLPANASFTTVASMTVSPARGPMGGQVTVNGTGFAAASTVAIQIGGATVKNTTTDATGSFTDKFVVPFLPTGSHNVNVTDGTNIAGTAFAVTVSFSISPTTGHIGSSLAVSGNGFSGTVAVKYDDTTMATVAADLNGAFSAAFTVPTSIHGPHSVSVSDSINKMETIFTVDSTPPPIPTMLLPQSGSRQGAQPTLSWAPVTDPSGVTYTLQIASDSSFNNLIVQKQGLTASQYSLASAERLPSVSKETPYYWRVRASDLAQNQGNWATPGSFYVSLWTAWAKWTLISMGALIALSFVFWLGMRFGPHILNPRPAR